MKNTFISNAIFLICPLIMFCIGIYQIKSKKPVSFYSGEKAPSKNRLTDVKAWNRKHGIMWILYGFCNLLSWVCGSCIGDSPVSVIPFVAGIILPLFFMAKYHEKLVRDYYIK